MVEHELQQAKLRVRHLQSAISIEEGKLVHAAIEAMHTMTPKLTTEELRSARGAEAVALKKLGSQIKQARERLEESRHKLREMLSDERTVLALAVEQGVKEYYSDSHKVRNAIRENQLELEGATLPGSAVSRLREEEKRLKLAVEQVSQGVKAVKQRRDRSCDRQQLLCNALRTEEGRAHGS
ncbi:hypothetical protein AB1Y20_020452 [Prymnesium parvum]|uniref:Uncharacterized protein n=1 Tax=Prymnesium parvum TaxID=97485 RepID=A0AB34JX56_PRYPA